MNANGLRTKASLIYIIVSVHDFSTSIMDAYQSLTCETAINTDFSELFSVKRI